MYIEIVTDDRVEIPVLFQGPKGEKGEPGEATPEFIQLVDTVDQQAGQVAEDREIVVNLANANQTVNTYQDAVALFTGSVFRRIDVISDSVHNLDEEADSPTFGQGLPSFYTYNPKRPAGKRIAFFDLDFDYLTN